MSGASPAQAGWQANPKRYRPLAARVGVSGVQGGLPLVEAPLDEDRPGAGIIAVENGQVFRVGARVDAGRLGVEGVGTVRAGQVVAVGAIDRLELER
jgi:hypothetical protein